MDSDDSDPVRLVQSLIPRDWDAPLPEESQRALMEYGARQRLAQGMIERMILRWARLVRELEHPPVHRERAEYVNELYTRHGLKKVIEEIPGLRAVFSPALDQLDERFRRATVPLDEPLHRHDDWWWYRAPPRLYGHRGTDKG